MAEITAGYIFNKLSRSNPIAFAPQFSLKDLVGKTIKENKRIKYRKFRAPKRDFDDPHFNYRYIPHKLDVIIFSDGTFLAAENRGNGECSSLGCYYFDGKNTLYSSELFEGRD